MADILSSNVSSTNHKPNSIILNETEAFVICSVGIVLNVFVISILLKYRENGGIVNILLVNLSVIDLLTCLSVITVTAIAALKLEFNRNTSSRLDVRDVMCKICLYTTTATSFCSTYVLATLAIERYRAICYPLNSGNYRRRYSIAIVFIWLISSALSAYTIAFSQYEPHFHPYVCFLKGLNYTGSKIWVLLSSSFGYGIPVFVTVCCYIAVVYKFVRSKIPGELPDLQTTYTIKRRKKMQAVTILLIITIISFIPKCILYIFTNISSIRHATSVNNTTNFIVIEPSSTFDLLFFRFISLIMLAQVIVNPLLYNFVCRKFRGNVSRYIAVALSRFNKASS
ncbi:Somatostatin receptor type 5 [Trichoplax sp. H2]|nr:Somatostatin receptor type 5 [Trichoplax sp. H2]|eukprot:RDD36765.1 Somatostatin receptor type 5 [Trichoplax sp. H2]